MDERDFIVRVLKWLIKEVSASSFESGKDVSEELIEARNLVDALEGINEH